MSDQPVVTTKNLVKRFGSQVAVDGISLTVNQGDVYGFLGLNGAGKTTSMRMLMGLLRADSGSIRIFGAESVADRRQVMARVGAMVESPSFYGHMSGRKNLQLLGSLAGPLPKGRIDEVLEIVGLSDSGSKKAKHFSLGMKQRLSIGLAILGEPDLVVLDEPANGLDPNGIIEMRHLIRRLNQEKGTTFIVSSHLLYEIELMCNRIAILEKGRLLYEGPPESFGRQDTPRFRACGNKNSEIKKILTSDERLKNITDSDEGGVLFECEHELLPSIHKSLALSNAELYTLQEEKMTLEEFFIQRTGDEQAGLPS
ncbi:MAG: ABC-type multidrug transport system ATPase subunit [Planctomycetota bacterium]|jgi:ABC-type multidrug transport system ATPase subunit